MCAAAEQEDAEPEWVEVMVDILLSLLSQQSRHIRQVCKTVFSSICPNVTAAALSAILEVSNQHALAHSHVTSHDLLIPYYLVLRLED